MIELSWNKTKMKNCSRVVSSSKIQRKRHCLLLQLAYSVRLYCLRVIRTMSLAVMVALEAVSQVAPAHAMMIALEVALDFVKAPGALAGKSILI